MGWEAGLVLIVVAAMVFALAREWCAPDALTVGCLLVLVIAQGLFDTKSLPNAKQAIEGFGKESLISVGVLFIIVTGLMQTGAMNLLTESSFLDCAPTLGFRHHHHSARAGSRRIFDEYS